MIKKRRFNFIAFVLCVVLFLLACNGGGILATPTPASTNTPLATNTSRPRPTSTPKPADTSTPLPPTPAPVGETVRSETLEMTVLSAAEIRRVYMGDYYYYPKANQMFVEFFVKVTNLTGSELHIPWKNIYVVEDTGDSWYPNWGGFKALDTGKTVESSSIGVHDTTDGNSTVDFKQDVYLRIIWFLTKKDKTTILFGFDDSPNITITIE